MINLKKYVVGLMPGKPMMAASVAILFMGISPAFVRVTEIGPNAVGFYRMFFALGFLVAWAMKEKGQHHHEKLSKGQTRFWALLAGLLLALDLGCWHLAIHYTEIVNASLFNNMMPIFMPFLIWMFYARRPNWRFLIAISIAITGATIVMGEGMSIEISQMKGNLLALGGALFYACYMIVVAKLRRVMTAPRITVWITFCCGLFMLLFAIIAQEKIALSTKGDWFGVIALALCSQVIGQALLTYAAGHLSEGLLSLMILFATVVAGITGWIAFGEELSFLQLLGGVVVIGSIVYARYVENLTEKRYGKNAQIS